MPQVPPGAQAVEAGAPPPALLTFAANVHIFRLISWLPHCGHRTTPRSKRQAYERYQVHFTVAQIFTIARVVGRPVEYFLGLDTGLTPDEERALSYYRAAREADRGEMTLRILMTLAGDSSTG